MAPDRITAVATWEYVTLYLRKGDEVEPRVWLIFSHEVESGLADRLPVLAAESVGTMFVLDPEQAGTSLVLRTLGDEGWEMVSTCWVPPLQASCLYFKRSRAQ